MTTPTKVVRVKAVKRIEPTETICDITVEDNHNLYTCASITDAPVLVHNCSMDTQTICAIHERQIEQASLITLDSGESYLPYYHRMMLVQMTQMIRVQSVMRQRGTQVNRAYLNEVTQHNGPVDQQLQKLANDFYADKDIKAANDAFRIKQNLPANSIFGTAVTANLLDIKKRECKQFVFAENLKLEPLAVSPKTGEPKYDKFFFKHYKETYPAIGLLARSTQLEKIKSAFLKAFSKKLRMSSDCRKDGRIRPDFGYLDVVTGRSNSSGPSLQQIPEHNEDAKIVKFMFTTPPLKLHFEADYSAHEVRNWGIMSDDAMLLKTFQTIHDIIMDYRRKPTEEKQGNLKKEADPHRLNYQMFTGKPAGEVTDEERQAAKGITFGSMYGMSPQSLAGQIKRELDETIEIMDRFFHKFSKAKHWLDYQVEHAEKHLFVISPIGRRRNLFGNMSAHRGIKSAMSRRAQNSPIQGFASDLCFMAADLYSRHIHEALEALGNKWSHTMHPDKDGVWYLPNGERCVDTIPLPIGPNAMVHDSCKGEAEFEYWFLHVHILEWAMTNGVKEHMAEIYKFDIGVCYDIEFEVGCDWAHKNKWSWDVMAGWGVSDDDIRNGAELRKGTIEYCVTEALKGHKELYAANDDVQKAIKDPVKTMLAMKKCYAKQAKKLKLFERYPLNDAVSRGYKSSTKTKKVKPKKKAA